MRDISTAMLVMELFNRTQLYLSEPDPQYDTALDDIHSQSDEVFIQFAKSLFAAHRAMIPHLRIVRQRPQRNALSNQWR